MNSSKTVLDASLLEAMFYTIQYSTVLLYNWVQYVFQHIAKGELFCCSGLISEWVLIHHELWDVFQVCVSSPKLTSDYRDAYSLPKRQAKLHKEKWFEQKNDIYSKKIMAARHSHFFFK